MVRTLRIANAQGFWGDRTDAARETLQREPGLDYLTLDYLAEVSLSLMAVQRERNPALGYARDFIEVVRTLAPYWAGGGRCRLVTNAGGLNPLACARACAAELEQAGCRSLNIGVVSGDDVADRLRGSPHDEWFRNLDSGASAAGIIDRLVTANAYVGAAPIVEALALGADIVITGRVADPSLTVAPCLHHFGWHADDWDRLAGATVAGHLIECGCQVTGGVSTEWLGVPGLAEIGFPIVEVAADGSCVVAKPQGSGGQVTERTVKEQLLYEIGDPGRYLSPDAVVSFLGLRVEDLGNDRVRLSGARGAPAPETLKVSATYRDGYRAAGTLVIFGRNAVEKARRCGEIVLQRVQDAGFELRDAVVECLGTSVCAGGALRNHFESEQLETVLRIAVEAETEAAVERFSRELMPLVTAGPQGTTGYADGRPRVQPIFRYWPCLAPRAAVTPRVAMLRTGAGSTGAGASRVESRESRAAVSVNAHLSTLSAPSTFNYQPSTLAQRAYARSGDKGTGANIGVAALTPEDYPWLVEWLTAERVERFFHSLGVTKVERHLLPNLQAMNFVLQGILQRSLRSDAQGKTLGQALLEMPVEER